MTISNEAALFKVESIHQIHLDKCLCGFKSSISRDRTKHIMEVTLEAAAAIIRAEALRATAEEMRAERHSWCLDDAGRYWIKRTLDELAARAVAERGGQ